MYDISKSKLDELYGLKHNQLNANVSLFNDLLEQIETTKKVIDFEFVFQKRKHK